MSNYSVAQYGQFLSQELAKAPAEVLGCIGRALRRYSPQATPTQLRDYSESIYSTVADEEGDLRPDWQAQLAAHHA